MHCLYIVHYKCNMACSFCYQKDKTINPEFYKEAKHNLKEYEFDIEEKYREFKTNLNRCIEIETKHNEMPQKIYIEFHGGELFCWNNGNIVKFLEKVNEYLEYLNKTEKIIFHIDLVTNLLYKDLNDLINSYNIFKDKKHVKSLSISTSFDFKGRFLKSEHFVLWKDNISKIREQKLVNKLLVQCTTTKEAYNALINKNGPLYEYFEYMLNDDFFYVIFNKFQENKDIPEEERKQHFHDFLKFLWDNENMREKCKTFFSHDFESEFVINSPENNDLSNKEIILESKNEDNINMKTLINADNEFERLFEKIWNIK